MNEGVRILLERMETNPEEFVPEYDGGVTKWGSVIGHYRTYLKAEDNKALEDAWRETVAVAMQEKFTAAVMKELLAPEVEENILGKPWYTGNVTASRGVTLGHSTGLTNGGFTLTTSNSTGQSTWDNRTAIGTSAFLDAQRYQTEQLRIQLDAQREVMKLQEAKPTTLFGKLFNYS